MTTDARAQRHVVDTTLEGYSNAGHTFGDHLAVDERAAVIEYLKTLGWIGVDHRFSMAPNYAALVPELRPPA